MVCVHTDNFFRGKVLRLDDFCEPGLLCLELLEVLCYRQLLVMVGVFSMKAIFTSYGKHCFFLRYRDN